jgi:cyclopropane fatty-acyl-phospholipid synthase-like methyltransferase
MRAISLAGFDEKFFANDDPWSTWNAPDEVLKRKAILQAMPVGVCGRVLEIGAGNGSNSRALAARSLRLDATEATSAGTALVDRALAGRRRSRALRLVAPDRLPRSTYDAVVIAELLYYLRPHAMAELARQMTRCIRVGGTLILAHHRITFYDFAQHAEHIHDRFLADTGTVWRSRLVRRTDRWLVQSCTKLNGPAAAKVHRS